VILVQQALFRQASHRLLVASRQRGGSRALGSRLEASAKRGGLPSSLGASQKGGKNKGKDKRRGI
jgi:hypothetical protein